MYEIHSKIEAIWSRILLFCLDLKCKKRPDAKMIQDAKMQILV